MMNDTWFDDEVTLEVFKGFAAYNIGIECFSVIRSMSVDTIELILQLRLQILRKECDRIGGTEQLLLSSSPIWSKRKDLKDYSTYFI